MRRSPGAGCSICGFRGHRKRCSSMPDPPGTHVRLLESLATTEPLAEVFSDASLLAEMLRFEAALARAEAGTGIIPGAAADAIARATAPDTFDPRAIARAARASG